MKSRSKTIWQRFVFKIKSLFGRLNAFILKAFWNQLNKKFVATTV